jgi:hypothetical protein
MAGESRLKNFAFGVLRVLDLILAPLVIPAAILLKFVRRAGVHRMPFSRRVLLGVGVLPVRNHYYEPQFDFRGANTPPSGERTLPGIDWNEAGQLQVLDTLRYAGELAGIGSNRTSDLEFHFGNVNFESGDAEYWYQMVRATKPRRLFEIGSGNSTLLAVAALRRTSEEVPGYRCEHVCIEPYEMQWLERSGVSVLRKRVEELDPGYFEALESGDILFIDSSHVIRPYGDVLFEYLEILPRLAPGVIVHIHDIFSPRNYPAAWIEDEVRLWNEQYLLEAFLSGNRNWRVLGALNFLRHRHFDRLKAVAPYLTPDREPGSFYIQRVS